MGWFEKEYNINRGAKCCVSPLAHTGYIVQNVYLYCASEGLATVVRLWFDKPAIGEEDEVATRAVCHSRPVSGISQTEGIEKNWEISFLRFFLQGVHLEKVMKWSFQKSPMR